MTGIEPILNALEAQLGCYERLARLAEAQREHVQTGSAEALLRLLQDRQAVLEELSRLEQVVAPARRQWTQFCLGLTVERRAHAEALVRRCRALLEQITQSDQDDVMILQQRKLNVGRQISQASTTRQVNRAYAATAYGGAGTGASTPAGRMDVSQ